MQKRFCSCGGAIWVSYLFINMRWMTFFFSTEDGRHALKICPHCGRTLDIQTLS